MLFASEMLSKRLYHFSSKQQAEEQLRPVVLKCGLRLNPLAEATWTKKNIPVLVKEVSQIYMANFNMSPIKQCSGHEQPYKYEC